jgi:hypothetical protein
MRIRNKKKLLIKSKNYAEAERVESKYYTGRLLFYKNLKKCHGGSVVGEAHCRAAPVEDRGAKYLEPRNKPFLGI